MLSSNHGDFWRFFEQVDFKGSFFEMKKLLFETRSTISLWIVEYLKNKVFYETIGLDVNSTKLQKIWNKLGLDVNSTCPSRKIYWKIFQEVSPPQNSVSALRWAVSALPTLHPQYGSRKCEEVWEGLYHSALFQCQPEPLLAYSSCLFLKSLYSTAKGNLKIPSHRCFLMSS